MHKYNSYYLAGVLVLFLFFGGACTSRVSTVDSWELVWEDNFDTLDSSRWSQATHTFENNLARFRTENITFEGGRLRLSLKKENYLDRSYTGAEYRTVEKYAYGKFVVRMKAVKGSGSVCSFFTYIDASSNEALNEIDFEFLGKNTQNIHTNAWDRLDNEHYQVISQEADLSADFHEYAIEWQPDYIKWYFDNVLIRTATNELPSRPMQIMMNLWLSSSEVWAGPVDTTVLPLKAEYDWVRYYIKR